MQHRQWLSHGDHSARWEVCFRWPSQAQRPGVGLLECLFRRWWHFGEFKSLQCQLQPIILWRLSQGPVAVLSFSLTEERGSSRVTHTLLLTRGKFNGLHERKCRSMECSARRDVVAWGQCASSDSSACVLHRKDCLADAGNIAWVIPSLAGLANVAELVSMSVFWAAADHAPRGLKHKL